MSVPKTVKSAPLSSYYLGIVYLEPKVTREVDVFLRVHISNFLTPSLDEIFC